MDSASETSFAVNWPLGTASWIGGGSSLSKYRTLAMRYRWQIAAMIATESNGETPLGRANEHQIDSGPGMLRTGCAAGVYRGPTNVGKWILTKREYSVSGDCRGDDAALVPLRRRLAPVFPRCVDVCA